MGPATAEALAGYRQADSPGCQEQLETVFLETDDRLARMDAWRYRPCLRGDTGGAGPGPDTMMETAGKT